MTWELPKYIENERSIQPPSDAQCKMLIASARGALSLRIDISVQTGLRPIEVQGYKGLRAKDIHLEQRTITALSTKGCNPRPPMPDKRRTCSKTQPILRKTILKPKIICSKEMPEDMANTTAE